MKGGLYHQRTSYSRGDLKSSWFEVGTEPKISKSYSGAPFFELPRDITFKDTPLEEILFGRLRGETKGMTLYELSGLLFLSYGITATSGGGLYFFRSVPSAGALYPCELYLAVSGIEGLPVGLYHYNSFRHGLEQIGSLKGKAFSLQFFVTALFYRSSCKYRERAFRYVLLDGGHLLEQVYMSSRFYGLSCRESKYEVKYLENLLAIEPSKETVLGSIDFGDELELDEIIYTQEKNFLREISSIARIDPVPPVIIETSRETSGKVYNVLSDLDTSLKRKVSFEIPFYEASISRRSRRNFTGNSIEISTLESLCQSFVGINSLEDIDIFVVSRNISGLDDGIYLVEGEDLRLVKRGSFVSKLSYAALDQLWLSNAVAHVIMASRISEVEKNKGKEAYRNVLITCGRVGQRLYLASEALRLGCCAIGAYYDDEILEILQLSEENQILYMLGIGVPKRLFTKNKKESF